MASFFKGTCMIYWFIWLVCLSYYMGTAIYTSHYIMTTDATHLVFIYLRLVCLFNIGFCFVGCVFTKLSVTHVLCAVSFVLPLLGVNFVGCILGISATRKVVAPTSEDVIDNINKSLQETNDLPSWFHNTQYWLACCGVDSYLDYPLKFHVNSTSGHLSSVIPSTCCPEQKGNPDCNLHLDSNDPTEKRVTTQILDELEQKCVDLKADTYKDLKTSVFRPVHNINNMISPCGCIGEIEKMTDGLFQSHMIFFLIMILMSIIMVVVYLKAWCRHNGDNADSGSQHTLDIEDPPSVRALIAASAPEPSPSHTHNDKINSGTTGKGSAGQQQLLTSVSVVDRIPNKVKATLNLRRSTIISGVPVPPSARFPGKK